MKRMVSMLLCLAMLLCSVTALAAAPTISDMNLTYGHWNPPYDHNVWKELLNFNIDTDAKITATIYDATGKPYNTPKINGDYADNFSVPAGKVSLYWPAVDYNGWHPGTNVTGAFKMVINAANSDGKTVVMKDWTYIFAHDITDHTYNPDDNAPIDPVGWQKERYTHNNIRSFGPRFKDIAPEMTKKWYRFTPVDLSQDGTQTFDMISGDHYVIGKVKVTVKGDTVKVTYKYNMDEIWDWKGYKFYTFFSDFDSVNEVEPEKITNRFEYGKEYSIEKDLNGDTDVLLYLCNKATHNRNEDKLIIFRETYKPYVKLRDAMLERIEKTLAK